MFGVTRRGHVTELRHRTGELIIEATYPLPRCSTRPRGPTRPYGHPDLLLGRAASLGIIIITADEAELISRTRIGHLMVEQLAARNREDPAALRMRRRRAEKRVVRALTEGLLGGIALDATFVKKRYRKRPATSKRRFAQEPQPEGPRHAG